MMARAKATTVLHLGLVLAIGLGPALPALADEEPLQPGVREVEFDPSVFSPDPVYEEDYDAQAQRDIYGAKYLNRVQNPFTLFRRLYGYGAYREPLTWFGDANPMEPQFMIFGDARTAVAYNDNGADETGLVAATVNFEIDLRLTSTERFHALMQPLQDGGQFTRFEFAGDDVQDFEEELDPNPTTAFFEGDLGAIGMGITGKDNRWDLPFAGGYLMPLLYQNGIWMEDAFSGFSFAIPAKNSRRLDISNMDVAFFVGLDQVNTAATGADDNGARIYGFNAFIEALDGYWEAGYGFTEDRVEDRDYHNLTVAYTRRIQNYVSMSGRVIGNVGQDSDLGTTANGVLVLIESSLITSKPSTFIPYMNLYFGYDQTVPIARGAGAIKNTGILFESDALTGFPFLDDTGFNSFGGAVGLNWLADDFGWQLVTEIAGVKDYDDSNPAGGGKLEQDQIGAAVRVQVPITNAFLVRADAMYAIQADADDLLGGRLELRYKF